MVKLWTLTGYTNIRLKERRGKKMLKHTVTTADRCRSKKQGAIQNEKSASKGKFTDTADLYDSQWYLYKLLNCILQPVWFWGRGRGYHPSMGMRVIIIIDGVWYTNMGFFINHFWAFHYPLIWAISLPLPIKLKKKRKEKDDRSIKSAVSPF